jgi:hypothetical protein
MSAAVETMLYATLHGDATLNALAPGGVWRDVAPANTTGTIVVFSLAAADDQYALAHRAYTEGTYAVKVITPGDSAAPAWTAAERVETLLTDASLTLTGGRVLNCRRRSSISMTEVDNGEQYQHVGGIYTITTQE